MAFWFLLRKAAFLTILCAISYAEKDLLETLKPKRNDPPELVDFLESLLKVKDEFKEIREAAGNDHKSSSNTNNFLADSQDDSDMGENDFSSNQFSASERLLKRRSRRRDSFRPINDVYPYMYEDGDHDDEMVPDEREERSSWKDVKERKPMYRKSKRDRIRQRRGLDLNDYNSDKDSELSNIKVVPRGRTGFRIVPGNKYEQRREVYPNYERKIARRRYNVPHKRDSFLWNGIPYTKLRIPKDRSVEHDRLDLKVDSANTPTKHKGELLAGKHGKTPGRHHISENILHKNKVNKESKKFGVKSASRRRIKSMNKNREERSMKLNIIDDNNLIQSIKQDEGTQSVVLTLRNINSHKSEDKLRRKMHLIPESHFIDRNTDNALKFAKTFNVQNIPSKSLAPSQPSNAESEVMLLKDNPINMEKLQDKVLSASYKPLVVYQIEAQENPYEETYSLNIHPQKEKKTMLEDVDEPTSALEQYDLSTKPYVLSAAATAAINYKKRTSSLKVDADLSDMLATTANPNYDQFIVKDSPDMVHGKHTSSFLIVDKRSADLPNQSQNNKLVTEKTDPSRDFKFQQDFRKIMSNNDYDGTVNNLRNKYNTLREVIGNHEPDPEIQLIEELSHIKPERSDSNNNRFNEENKHNYDYHQEPSEADLQQKFQSRRLQSFPDYDVVSDGLIRYGNIDYENGRNRRMKLPGYTENKIRVKRGLTDLFGMSNDEDYSEDLAEEDSSILKQERSDDSYDEEADSAVAEALAYDKKKNQQNNSDKNLAESKTEETEFTFVETFRKSTTENSKNHQGATKTRDIQWFSSAYGTDFKTDIPFPKLHSKIDFTVDKANGQPFIPNFNNIESSSLNDLELHDGPRDNNGKCRNCQNSKELQIGNGKCSCSTENKKCNCQHGNLIINKRQPKELDETDGKFKTVQLYQVDVVKNYENGFTHNNDAENKHSNIGYDERIKYKNLVKHKHNNEYDGNNTVPCGKELHTIPNNTYHSKPNNSMCKNTLEPEKEDPNDDQINYKFGKLDHENCSETSTNTSDQHFGNEKGSNAVTDLSDPYMEQKLAVNTDLDENDSYAHHPKHNGKLDNKQCHTGKDKPKAEEHTVHFPKKYNQNKLKPVAYKSEREELPELETVINKKQAEADTQNRPQRNRDNSNPDLSAYSIELENSHHSTKEKREIHKTHTQEDQDALNGFPLKEPEDGNIIQYNPRETKQSANNQGEINADKKNLDKTQNYDKRSVDNNIISSANNSNLREKKGTKLLLLNSVNSFDNIIEDNSNKKKINKREANEYWDRIKFPKEHLIKRQNLADAKYFDTDNSDLNMLPMERFPKFRNNYWKKRPLLKYRKVPYAHQSYKTLYLNHPDEDFQKLSPQPARLNYEEKNPDQYEYADKGQPLDYSNMDNLRRFRRDGFSKDPTDKESEQNVEEDSERDEAKNPIAKQSNSRSHKGKRKNKCKNEQMKEWVQPKGPRKPTKRPCFLDQEKNINPVVKGKPASCGKDDSSSNKMAGDYGQMHDAVNGHLASLIVQAIYKKLKQHKQLSDRFGHGLYRTHGFKSEMKDLNAFRNTETEGDIKHTEEMLHQIMGVLNKIILDQVRRRTCKHLSPEIQKYLSVIIKVGKGRDDRVDEDSKISEEGFPLPLVVKGAKTKEKPVDTEQGDFLFNNPDGQSELNQDEVELKKKIKMINALLEKYKNMSSRCKVRFEDVEAYLKKHLCLLKKMLKKLKKQKAAEQGAKQRAHAATNKLKRKNYDFDAPQFNFIEHDFQPDQQDLINKQLESVGLGSSKTYTPAFNIDEIVQNNLNKLNSFKKNIRSLDSSKEKDSNSKSKYEDVDESIDSDDYENPKNERKREAIDNSEHTVSDKYRKLVEAAESFRTKRDAEERLGKLFGKTQKRSVKNEDDDAINSENSDYSNIGFESPRVFSLKK